MTWARTNDRLEIAYAAAFSPPSVGASLDVRRPDGTIDHYHDPETTSFTSSRSIITIPGDVVHADGEVVGGSVHGDFTGMRRGQFFVMYRLLRPGTDQLLAKGYVYALNPLGLGNFEDSRSGMGNRFWNTLVDDVTPVTIVKELAITNAYRVIHGFAWYYNCAAETATRVLEVRLLDVSHALPTGMSAGTDSTIFWAAPQLTLTTGEEGAQLTMERRSMVNDDGSLTIVNNATDPTPFPYSVIESDLANLKFIVGSPHADDRHSIYVDIEEWLEP